MALCELRDGRRGCVVVTTQGDRVQGRELIAVHQEQDPRDWAWREEAYRRYFQRKEPDAAERLKWAREVAPAKGADVVSGEGVGLTRSGRLWAIYRLEWEGDKVIKSEVEEAAGELLYVWDRLSSFAERFLLGDWRSRV